MCPGITDEAVAALSFAGRTKVTSCLAKYWQRSLKRNNAVILFNHNPVLLVSRRDIKAGTDILMSYGPAYWLQQAAGVQLSFNILEWMGPALPTFGLKLRATLGTCAQEEEEQMKFAKRVAVVASLAARRAFMAKGGSLTEVTDPGLFGEMVGLSSLVGALSAIVNTQLLTDERLDAHLFAIACSPEPCVILASASGGCRPCAG